MKYTVYVNSANCASTETLYWTRNRSYFTTRAKPNINNGFRDLETLGETYRIP